MPLVSIITPAYNAERFLRQTIVSVCEQTFADWELLIVVDGKSADGTERLARDFAMKDSRIRVIAEGSRGVAANRNLGLKTSRGQLICFLDSDDWWHREKLAIQTKFMGDRGARISCSAYHWMPESGTRPLRLVSVPQRFGYRRMLFGNQIGCLTVMLERSLLPHDPFADVGHEDYALWLQLLRNGDVVHGIDRSLAYYRKVRNSLSGNKIRTIAWRWRILRNQEQLWLPLAFICTIVGSMCATVRVISFHRTHRDPSD